MMIPYIEYDNSLNKKLLYLFLLFQIPFFILIYFSQNHVLAFDSMQFGGAVPNYIFENNFKQIEPPDIIDSGHPPGFALYIALLWKFFDQSLEVSHWAMYPIVLITIYQILKLLFHVFKTNISYVFISACILIFQSTIFAQSTQVSPDNFVIAFSLMLINGVLFNKRLWVAVSVIILGCVSVRGMSIAILVWLIYFAMQVDIKKGISKQNIEIFIFSIKPFIWGGLIGGGYLLYHYYLKGWITPNSTTSWGDAFNVVPLKRILEHQVFLIWRMLDIGGVGIITLSVLLIFYALYKKKLIFDNQYIKYIFFLFVLLFVFTVFPLTFYQGLLSHRYLIVFTTLLIFLGIYVLYYSKFKYKIGILILCFFIQLSGHFWQYPQNLSVSWDCTLAHFPYYSLRDDFINFIDRNKIHYDEIVSGSPMYESNYNIYYGESREKLKTISEKGIGNSKYIWYSNVSNDMRKKKREIEELYKPLYKKKKGSIEMILYRKNDM
jgi:hypothetical protein